MIPGSNILLQALGAIQPQTVTYYAFAARITNSIGIYQNMFAAPVDFTGSFQAVPRNLYVSMGLDLQKEYAKFFVPANIIDVSRDVAGDNFSYNSQRWQAESKTSWFGQDGWVEVLCVAVPNPDTVSNFYTSEQAMPYTTEDGIEIYITET